VRILARPRAEALTIRPIETMINHATTEVFFDGLEIPADALVGEEGNGFRLRRGAEVPGDAAVLDGSGGEQPDPGVPGTERPRHARSN
jgi:hypothetical protein